jgi:hypothetical protein
VRQRTNSPLASSWTQASNCSSAKPPEAVLPAASVAVQVTVLSPIGKAEPAGGSQQVTTHSPGLAEGSARILGCGCA